MSKCYCEDHNLELRGIRGPRWPVDPTKYTFHLCYRCGREWSEKEKPIEIKPIKIKSTSVPVRKVKGFAVYKIMDGVVGLEPQ